MIQLTFPDDCEIIRYPGGESQVRLRPEFIPMLEANEDCSVMITARVRSATDIIELALFAESVDGVNLSTLTLVLPYLPYARADRRFLPGDTWGIRTFGNLISALAPRRIITMDAHSDAAVSEVSELSSIFPSPFIMQAIEESKSTILLYPDTGARGRYKYITGNFRICHADKQRDPVTGKLSGFEVPEDLIGNRNIGKILIVDDICDGGGTFLGIADKLNLPADRLALYVTHGIFSKGFHDLNKRFGKIYTTNSFQPWTSDENFRVFDCLPLLKG